MRAKEDCTEVMSTECGVELFHLLHVVSHRMERGQSLDRSGLKYAQGRLLRLIRDRGAVGQSELIEMMGIRSASLSELLMKLEAARLVVRTRDDSDKRNFRVSLTADGEEMCVLHEEHHERIAQRIFSGLTGDEQLELLGLIQKLLSHWEPRKEKDESL